MKLSITNFAYMVNGKIMWFASMLEALNHFKVHYPDIYKCCLVPEHYIQKVEKVYNLEEI